MRLRKLDRNYFISVLRFLHFYFLKKRDREQYKILCKYIPDINTVNRNIISAEQSDYIWIMWLQGEENAPKFVKKCISRIKKYHPQKNIKIVTKNSINNLIEVAPQIRDKFDRGKIPYAQYSDYLRVALLEKYGGTWIDSTVLLTGEIPDEIFKQDFFVFKNTLWYATPKVPSEKLFMSFLDQDYLFGSNWFINAKAGNIIIQLIKKSLELYWQDNDKLIEYFIFHRLLSIIIFRYEECRKTYENMYSLPNNVPHYLQAVMYNDYDEELFKEICSMSNIHKLTYKFKKTPKNSFVEYLLKEDINE